MVRDVDEHRDPGGGCASLGSNIVPLGTGHMSPYAGVQEDAELLSKSWQEEPSLENLIGGTFALIDLPLSAAMDTLLLPLSAR